MVPILPHVLHYFENGNALMFVVVPYALDHSPQCPRPANACAAVDPYQVFLIDFTQADL